LWLYLFTLTLSLFAFSALALAFQYFTRKHCLQISVLRMRGVIGGIDFLLEKFRLRSLCGDSILSRLDIENKHADLLAIY